NACSTIGTSLAGTSGSTEPLPINRAMSEMQHAHCPRHPQVETRLSCGKCDTFICPQCLVHTPVGARCPDCAQLRRLPIYDIGPTTYLRAVAAGTVLAGASGSLWGLLFFQLLHIPFLPWIATIGVGYVVGEGISVAVNRKRGRNLQIIAGACVMLSYVVALFVIAGEFAFIFPDLFFLLVLLIAIWVAADRVR
ncbi:MAG: hypothetical protein QGI09_12230, partial [Dehalococcoidia bacterium]|nr:hypothetical protein [Dehalococcoidia bacterium]